MSSKNNSIILFNQKKVRRHWDADQELWYFSVVDVIAILTDSPRPRKYWNALKTKLKEEGSQLSQNVGQLKLESADGKKYLIDVVSPQSAKHLLHKNKKKLKAKL